MPKIMNVLPATCVLGKERKIQQGTIITEKDRSNHGNPLPSGINTCEQISAGITDPKTPSWKLLIAPTGSSVTLTSCIRIDTITMNNKPDGCHSLTIKTLQATMNVKATTAA